MVRLHTHPETQAVYWPKFPDQYNREANEKQTKEQTLGETVFFST